jgi:hypothetical protein
MENESQNKSVYELAIEKSRKLGYFALTAEDHKAMGSTPSDELLQNKGKAAYEVMSDSEIEAQLDHAVGCLDDIDFIRNGQADIERRFLVSSIPFLKSMGRLPEKYKNFNIEELK